MGVALFLLGLLPLVFLTDFLPGGEDGADAPSDDLPEDDAVTGNGDMLADMMGETGQGGVQTGLGTDPVAASATDPVLPDDPEDDVPQPGDDIDPDTVLAPDPEDEVPPDGDPVDPDTVLQPDTEPDSAFPTDGDGTMLQQLLRSEADAVQGVGFAGETVNEDDTALTDGADIFAAPDDGEDNTGDGTFNFWNGTPILRDGNATEVIDGGAGDDQIATGDGAAYAFGGAGDDTLTAGEGAAALYGGTGADTLTGSDGLTAYLDGGDGNDTILGGDAAEVIEGGAHGPDDAGVPDDDTIDAGGGDDIVRGGFGADTISGGAGDDVIDHLGQAEERYGESIYEFGWHIDNEADVLDGGAGDDLLIMDRADTATGGDGADDFWVYFDETSGSGAAEITDFTVGEDFLRVTLNPDLGTDDPQVSVDQSGDGLDSEVRVNGNIVAVLKGVPDATVNDVYAEVVENMFA